MGNAYFSKASDTTSSSPKSDVDESLPPKDFSCRLLKYDYAEAYLPDDGGYTAEQEGLSSIKTSETFTDKKLYKQLGNAPLFSKMPCLDDIRQGNSKDCYLLSVLQVIVNKDPTIILNMMIDNGDGTVAVRLYDDTGSPHYYIIEKGLCQGFAKNCMWVQMIERAFLIHRRLYYSDPKQPTKFKNKKSDLDIGFSSEVLRAVTGITKEDIKVISSSCIEIIFVEKYGLAILCTDKNDENTSYECDHSYGITGYTRTDSGLYILVNEPYGGTTPQKEKMCGINYNPVTGTSERVEGNAQLWLKPVDFMSEDISNLEKFAKELGRPEFKYLKKTLT